ncbi:MAG TPA: hypothetical protein ENN92_00315, partial [candidate division WWE3 bacterium]|nr:hypothetical protein [candidate division WWE3 bacterium]
MPKTLVGKTQKIKGNLNPTEKKFSNAISISPDEEESISKRGHLYAIFNLQDTTSYETELTTKLIKDILGRSYYHSENASPIQALEKAIVDVKEDILHLQEEDSLEGIDEEDSKIRTKVELNIVASVLWSGVLYTVKHGKGKVFVVRGGEFKDIEMIKEGNFSVATGVVKKEDVVVLATEQFSAKFPPKKLLKLNPAEAESLNPEECCLMIKFEAPEGREDESTEESFGKKVNKPSFLKEGINKVKSIISNSKRKSVKDGVTAIGFKKPFKINRKKLSLGTTLLLGLGLIGAIIYTQ